MNPYWLLLPILFPMFAAVVMLFIRIRSRRTMRIFTGTVTVLTSVFAWVLILCCREDAVSLIRFTRDFTLTLRFDGAGRFFAGIIATLWPLTVLYAFEYMEKDTRQHLFFAFFTIAFGVTLGVSMSGNLFTLYCFYEMLTLSTFPLVMHTMTREAVRAARIYFGFSLGGAAFAFISMLYLVTGEITVETQNITRIFYVLGFFGFGVKAAVFPLDHWLPRASVAPTPVTALLHAVAVVKSGVFAIIRLTWFGYGIELIRGSFAEYIPMIFVLFTILYGSVRAVREVHWKRRLAYSTISNLSYILFGVLLLTENGLIAAFMHMAFHAEMKILAFFAAGAVMHKTGKEYIFEMDGMAKRMPVTFACFTVAALALLGIPPLAGFVSKWQLLSAAADAETVFSYIGAAMILVAALLTAVYCLTVVRRAYFPHRKDDPAVQKDGTLIAGNKVPEPNASGRCEASLFMLIPMLLLAAGILVTGLCSGMILNQVTNIVTNMVRW